MTTAQIVGTLIMVTGFVDLAIARFILDRKLPEGPNKQLVLNTLLATGTVFAVGGAAIAVGWIHIDGLG